ncbi:MAG: NADH-quinone oxidoreductase subunit K [Bacteroidota bacterium]
MLMVYYLAGILLILIGMYAVLVKKNIIKIVIGLSIVNSGINLLLIAIGYVKDSTAPIFSSDNFKASQMVDPVPQALVLTAIVIGLGVTAVALALVIRLYDHHKTLNINKIRKLKW